MPEPDTAVSRSLTSSSPVDPAWDEAFLRVESYLRAHHLESRLQLNQVATRIIEEARARKLTRPEMEPVALAMQVTHACIGAWFMRAGKNGDWEDERDRAHGRLALAIANLPGHWSNHFLATDPVPPELAAAMASFQFQPGPELRFSNMAPAPLDLGADDTGNPKPRKTGLSPLLRTAISWLMVGGLIGVAWAASH